MYWHYATRFNFKYEEDLVGVTRTIRNNLTNGTTGENIGQLFGAGRTIYFTETRLHVDE